MARSNTVEIIIAGMDRASGEVKKVQGALGGLKGVAGTIGKAAAVGLGALAGGATAAAAGILKLASDAAAIEPVERDFARLAESINETTDAMLGGMREASYGMVSDADLMQSANRLISMGLADSAEEASNLTRMAVRLGEAMGKGPTDAMEEFALMMANQSIPRLDTFGISAAEVRERMAELMEVTDDGGMTQGELNSAIAKSEGSIEKLQRQLYLATLRQGEYTEKTKESTRVAGQMRIEDLNKKLAEEQMRLENLRKTTIKQTDAVAALSREEAFAQAVRELGAESLERVGEGGQGAAASMARLQASVSNLKTSVGQAFIPVLAALLEPLSKLATEHGPRVIEWAQQLAGWLETNIPVAIQKVSEFWTGTLMPALADLQTFWTQTLQPTLANIQTWLQTNIPIAMAAVSDFWYDTLKPALADLATLWQEQLEPAVGEIVTWLGENIPIAMAAISTFWTETLYPAIEEMALWLGTNIPIAMEAITTFWAETLEPALSDLWEWLDTWVKPAVEAVSRVVIELVRIALEALYIILFEKVLPKLKEAWEWLQEKLAPAAGIAKDALEPLAGILERVQGWLADLAEKANAAAEALAKVKPSEWFTPGSPAPFEVALRGITDAAREATNAVQGLHAPSVGELATARAGAGVMGGRTVVVAPLMLDSRQYTNTRGDVDYYAVGKWLSDLEGKL